MSIKYFGNGKVFTSTDENTFATAFGIENGKFVWVGETSEIEDEYINLNEKTVLPAFVEAHMHSLLMARGVEQVPCLPPLINTIDEMIEALKEKAATLAPGEWIEGYGFDESKLFDHRAPNINDLDKVSTENPILLIRSDYHSYVVNSKALELAGIDKDTPDMQGGEIKKFENGEPNGFLLEKARHLIDKVKPPNSQSEDARLLYKYGEELSKMGFSTISEMMATVEPENYFKVYEEAIKLGFKQRANLYFVWDSLKENKLPDISKFNKVEGLEVKGVKVFLDGDIVSQTAYMIDPYPFSENRGLPVAFKEDLLEAYEYVKDKNLQLSIHAMGDASIELILETFKDMEPWVKEGPSIRIEHGAVMSEEQIEKAAKLKIGITHQPIFMFAEYKNYRKSLDDEKFYRTFPSATSYKNLDYFSLSSDAPATTWYHPEDPFLNIEIAVNRVNKKGFSLNKSEKLSLPEAIIAYTRKAAEIGGLKNVGAIDKGYDADFIILNEDVFNVPNDKISEVKIEKTFLKGELQ